jgi:hypothetical protein
LYPFFLVVVVGRLGVSRGFLGVFLGFSFGVASGGRSLRVFFWCTLGFLLVWLRGEGAALRVGQGDT